MSAAPETQGADLSARQLGPGIAALTVVRNQIGTFERGSWILLTLVVLLLLALGVGQLPVSRTGSPGSHSSARGFDQRNRQIDGGDREASSDHDKMKELDHVARAVFCRDNPELTVPFLWRRTRYRSDGDRRRWSLAIVKRDASNAPLTEAIIDLAAGINHRAKNLKC